MSLQFYRFNTQDQAKLKNSANDSNINYKHKTSSLGFV